MPLSTAEQIDEAPGPLALITLANALADQGRIQDALAQVRTVLAMRSIDLNVLRRAAAVADACGDPDVGAACWAALCRLEPWQPKWRSRLAMMAVEQADYGRAYDIVRKSLEAWPNDPTLRRLAVSYGSMSGRSNSWEEDAILLAADESASTRARLEAARHLVGLGQTAAARAALLMLTGQEDDPEIARAARAELKSVDILEAAGEEVSCAVPGYLGMGRPAVFHRASRSAVTAIVFVGLAGKVGIAVNVLHAILAPLGVNVVYLFDEDRVTHLNGNRAFGSSYVETVDRMQSMLAAWGTKRLVSVGNSAGGSAAIRYGLDLGAERIISFGGATTLDPQAIWDQGRARSVISRMKRLVPHMLTDLKPLLERASPAPQVDLYFGADMAGDRAYAEHLADLPNVRLHPVEGSDRHKVVNDLVELCDLAEIFAEAFREPAPQAEICLTPHLLEYLLPE